MNASEFYQFVSRITSGFTPVIDSKYKKGDYVYVDLSEANKELLKINISSSGDFSKYINKYLQKKNKKVAFGGYNEVRQLYVRSGLFTASEEKDLNRNIHIGLDLWVGAGTAVLAVLDGKIHSFQDNIAFGDYGPTIILEHEVADRTFYSLYGHLSKEALEGLSIGREVKKGQKIAELGEATENGDYAPHLHFQLMEDLQGKQGDYPGVASSKEIAFYLRNCPDPDLLLKIANDSY